jgi:hypothetical protein
MGHKVLHAQFFNVASTQGPLKIKMELDNTLLNDQTRSMYVLCLILQSNRIINISFSLLLPPSLPLYHPNRLNPLNIQILSLFDIPIAKAKYKDLYVKCTYLDKTYVSTSLKASESDPDIVNVNLNTIFVTQKPNDYQVAFENIPLTVEVHDRDSLAKDAPPVHYGVVNISNNSISICSSS